MRVIPLPSRNGLLRLYAYFGGAAAWGAHLALSWALVPVVCNTESRLWIHALTVLTVLGAVGAIAVGTMLWRRRLREYTDEADSFHFLELSGLLMNVVFLLAILMQGAANFWLDPCDRSFGQ